MSITILKKTTGEIIEKKSRFIASIYPVETREEAEEKIKEIKKQHYDARHNCSAYRVIENQRVIEKFSDDGEPSGTAGGPILNILKNNDLVNIVVIVTRYFGGILLGTGGLVRAYSDATVKAIEEAEKQEICMGKEYKVRVDYSNIESIKYYCNKNNINIIKIQYLEDIWCNLEIENEYLPKFLKDIEERTLNILEYNELKEKYIRKK